MYMTQINVIYKRKLSAIQVPFSMLLTTYLLRVGSLWENLKPRMYETLVYLKWQVQGLRFSHKIY